MEGTMKTILALLLLTLLLGCNKSEVYDGYVDFGICYLTVESQGYVFQVWRKREAFSYNSQTGEKKEVAAFQITVDTLDWNKLPVKEQHKWFPGQLYDVHTEGRKETWDSLSTMMRRMLFTQKEGEGYLWPDYE